MAQPPGNETRASPPRATNGPSTRIEARMVLTISYEATGLFRPPPLSTSPSTPSIVTPTPMSPSRRSIVEMSFRCGTLVKCTGSAVSSEAQRIGSAAFLAPDMATSPERTWPPSINNLSTLGAPFFRGQGFEGQGMQLPGVEFILQNLVYMLLALHAVLADELAAHDDGLEMMAIAVERQVFAGHAGEDELLDLVRVHHVQPLSFQPRFSRLSVSTDTAAKQAKTTARLVCGATSETPKKP